MSTRRTFVTGCFCPAKFHEHRHRSPARRQVDRHAPNSQPATGNQLVQAGPEGEVQEKRRRQTVLSDSLAQRRCGVVEACRGVFRLRHGKRVSFQEKKPSRHEKSGSFQEKKASRPEMTESFREEKVSRHEKSGLFQEKKASFPEMPASFQEKKASRHEKSGSFQEEKPSRHENTAPFHGGTKSQ